jgi:hypothetical protein
MVQVTTTAITATTFTDDTGLLWNWHRIEIANSCDAVHILFQPRAIFRV